MNLLPSLLFSLALLGTDELHLVDLEGRSHAVLPDPGEAPLVLAWTSLDCPMSRVYAPRLRDLAAEFSDRGVRFLLVDSCPQDEAAELRARFGSSPVPLVHDADGATARRFEVRRTTEVLVFDAAGVLAYRGAVDDQYGYRRDGGVGTYRKDAPERRWLAEALEQLLAGKAVTRPRTDPMGCALGLPPAEPEAEAEVVFHRDIVPFLQARCQDCHHDGGNAPFALVEYDDVQAWAPMILEVVEQRRMPPWNADPAVGHFANDRSLDPTEITNLRRWVQSGTPEGDPAEAPEARVFQQGWGIGEPDVVYDVEEIDIPAEGRLPYRYVRVRTRFDEDRWIEKAQIVSSSPQVVHHVLVFQYLPPKAAEGRPWVPPVDQTRLFRSMTPSERSRLLPRLGAYTRDFQQGKGGGLLGYFLSGLPGDAPTVYPEGTAKLLPAKSTLIFQIHYNPNGEATRSGTRLALKFADSPPERAVDARAASTLAIEIPPGASDHVIEAEYSFPRGATLLSMAPHMHLRGKSAEYFVHYPDGRVTPLLRVPHFDFDWQLHYVLAEPLHVPKGTTLRARTVFDNSADNPYNPDPEQTVYFGLQTEEEMMICYFEAVWDQAQD